MRFIYLLLAVFWGPAVPASAQDICRNSFREVFPVPACSPGCGRMSLSDTGEVGRREGGNPGGRLLFGGIPAGNHMRRGSASAGLPAARPAIRLLPLSGVLRVWGWGSAACAAAVSAATLLAAGCLLRRRRKRRRQRAFYGRGRGEPLSEPHVRPSGALADGVAIPLSLINAACGRLSEYGACDERVRREVEAVRRNAQKIDEQVRTFSRFEAAAAAGRPEEIGMLDITRFCGGLMRTFEEYAAVNGISCRVGVVPDLRFPAPRDTLAVMVNALLSDAFRRAGPGGEVAFRATVEQDWLRIAVSGRVADAGRGQDESPSGRDVLSGRSAGAERAVRTPEEGPEERPGERPGERLEEGPGPAICRGLAARLGGDFRMTCDGKATVCELSLPGLGVTRTEEPAPQPDALSPRQAGPGAAPAGPAAACDGMLPAMLVISEVRDMAAFVTELFAGEYDITLVDDLNRAPGVFAAMQPRLIICGAASLDAAVVGVIRSIRSTRHLVRVPLILLTAAPRPDAQVESLGLGVDTCMTLPFDFAHLKRVAGQLLRRNGASKDYGRAVYSAFDLAQGRVLHNDDKAFLDKMLGIIRRNILDPSLSTQSIAGEMGMSLPNFYRKLGGLTELTPACIIREYRFGMAEQLLVTTKLSVDEIIYKSGFSNRSTFFRGFIARYGCTPKTYRERKNREALESEAV